MLIQYTRVVNSLKYMEPVFHFDITVKSVLDGHPVMHCQMSRDGRVVVQKRVKCSEKTVCCTRKTVMSRHEMLPVCSMKCLFHCILFKYLKHSKKYQNETSMPQ